MNQRKWDIRFLKLAEHKTTWSKDPQTKVGCVIALGKQDKYYGYNGFPSGIEVGKSNVTRFTKTYQCSPNVRYTSESSN